MYYDMKELDIQIIPYCGMEGYWNKSLKKHFFKYLSHEYYMTHSTL